MVDLPKGDTIEITEYFIGLLKYYEIDTVFGIVGIPIVELANSMITHGIKFISCRNEQAASYAASAYGFLTGKPAVLLVVGGPGLIHALAGVYNSTSNKWPLIVIAGSNHDEIQENLGGFQDLDQVSLLKDKVKYCGRLNGSNINSVWYNAYNSAIQPPTGVSYIDFPEHLISNNVRVPNMKQNISIPRAIKSSADPLVTKEVAQLLRRNSDQNVLVIIGKGAVNYSKGLSAFIHKYQFPFLPTPMGKGIISDMDPLNVSSARSSALSKSDIVLVFGARLNWLLHFGKPPKWKSTVKFILCDNDPHAIGNNNMQSINYSLLGDIGLIINELTEELDRVENEWGRKYGVTKELRSEILKNQFKLQEKESRSNTNGALLNYHVVYRTLREMLDLKNTFLVTEGANTMDIARISFPSLKPKQRLDAGTNATMGVGLGYGIAARLSQDYMKSKPDILVIQGDSAFGFSAIEIETAVRFKLGLIIIVINNSGIYHGTEQSKKISPYSFPATKLSQKCRYDLLGIGLGAHGYLVENIKQLQTAFERSLNSARTSSETSVINVIIEPGKQRQISFGWQNKSKL
ncbi:putative indolepyruvate decarboxylase family protein NDAI_0G00520 [Naumovozyma dairenensis CBS 421]|uniref:2-hydroxyacyl-CoA lyase n=1 Tax=Naumovozyma dairenensis (strain ATCC 10597 / BCRC 20456 / CBS 421 / NBRC 0211 / NRRL Y-12639) TaxID=1071378 RepID=G0WDG7_NAUDC|nr:hypothetical protein NDAI_0G00520 [Naumovozyma dairenensis CBS 421]CCD25828.2 hypothetical protein NDAI_0G00520 [Naumovozyma dairenensis CBS 421]